MRYYQTQCLAGLQLRPRVDVEVSGFKNPSKSLGGRLRGILMQTWSDFIHSPMCEHGLKRSGRKVQNKEKRCIASVFHMQTICPHLNRLSTLRTSCIKQKVVITRRARLAHILIIQIRHLAESTLQQILPKALYNAMVTFGVRAFLQTSQISEEGSVPKCHSVFLGVWYSTWCSSVWSVLLIFFSARQ